MNTTSRYVIVWASLAAACAMQDGQAAIPEHRAGYNVESAGMPSDEVRCEYTRRFVCDATGCRPGRASAGDPYLLVPSVDRLLDANPSVVYDHLFDDKPAEIRRCDSKGCTPVAVVASMAGLAFVNATSVESGYLFKLLDMDIPDVSALLNVGATRGEFVEVATLGLQTYIGFGRCRLPPR